MKIVTNERVELIYGIEDVVIKGEQIGAKVIECVECGEEFTNTDKLAKVEEQDNVYICRDCIEDSNDYVECVVCGKVYEECDTQRGYFQEELDKHICYNCEGGEYKVCWGCGEDAGCCIKNEEDLVSVNEDYKVYRYTSGREYSYNWEYCCKELLEERVRTGSIFKCKKCDEYCLESLESEHREDICMRCEDYTKEEVDLLVEENKDKILSYIRRLEKEYAAGGKHNKHDTFRILFDLIDAEVCVQVIGQGVSSDIIEGIEQGNIIEVYKFRSGDLEELAEEGIAGTNMTIDEYIEDYISTVLEIDIEYLNAVKE